MATPVIMPRQGQSVESCIIGKWHKAVGDTVAVGDILFTYETDKATFDEEAKEAGTMLGIFFEEGDDVFTLLQRVCRENKIHLEFSEDPIYSSAYVEGLHNLYEFDGGELSGWYYSANGWFPNYGSSRYVLEDGDVIEYYLAKKK